MVNLKKLKSCRICDSKNLHKYLNLGFHPYSNSFLSFQDIKKEKKYPLEIIRCLNCNLSQLSIIPDVKNIFRDYHYLSSSSVALSSHYKKLVNDSVKKFKLKKGDTVLDIGCNDGVLINHYNAKKYNILGIEPSNAIDKIKNKKIKKIKKFFNFKTSNYLNKKFNKPKIITVTNVLAQIENLNDFASAIKNISTSSTITIIEFPYLFYMLEKSLFDLIYHEHLSYFNLTSLQVLFNKHGLRINNFKKINLGASGPALRVYVALKYSNTYIHQSKIDKALFLEKKKNNDINTFLGFEKNVKKRITQLKKLILSLYKSGFKIGCYTAPAKGNTLLNCLNLKKDVISYASENNLKKIGKYTPGTHIKIISDEQYLKQNINYSLLLSWNYKNFFLKKSKFKKRGGKFIIPFPSIEIK